MKTLDFEINNNLDLVVRDKEYISSSSKETCVLQALMTDDRIEKERGYWIEILMSDFWIYHQSISNYQTEIKIRENLEKINNNILEEEYFEDKLDFNFKKIDDRYLLEYKLESEENNEIINKTINIKSN